MSSSTFYVKSGREGECPEGNQYAVDLQKGDDQVDFGFGLITNGRGYLEVVRITPNSFVSHSPIALGDLLVAVNNEYILKKGKKAYFTAVKKIAVGTEAPLLFCHPASRLTRTDDFSDDQKTDYYNRLTSAIDYDDTKAIQALNTGEKYFRHHIQLMNEIWPLHRAIKNNRERVTEMLISSRIIDLDAFSEQYKGTPLTLASLDNKFGIVEQLLYAEAYPSCEIQSVYSPLKIAIRLGFDDIAKLLAEKHDDLSVATTESYKCIIHLAVLHGRLELLNHWWSDDVDPNQSVSESLSSEAEFTPCRTLAAAFVKLEEALALEGEEKEKDCRKSIVKYLLDKGALIDNNIMKKCSTSVHSYMSLQKENFSTIANLAGCQLAAIDLNRLLDRDLVVKLDLSENFLKFLPSWIPWEFRKIEKFTMNNCTKLTELAGPKNKKPDCKKLTVVNFDKNPLLTTVAIDYFRLKSLVELNITQSALTRLPGNTNDNVNKTQVWKCYKLEILNLRGNKLEELPDAIKLLKSNSIRKLFASNNQLLIFPDSWNKGVLEVLDLSGNRLTHLNVSQFNKSLTKLYLNNNCFASFPKSICELEKLILLDMSNNHLEQLPDCEWKCKNLTILNLADNLLCDCAATPSPPAKNFPFTSIFKRKTSSSSNLSWNMSNTNPPGSVVSSASVSSNYSTSSRQSKEINLPKVCDDKLDELKLNGNRLFAVPSSVLNYKHLTTLDISSNSISDLPPALASCRWLADLNVTALKLPKMPRELNPEFNETVSTKLIMNYLSSQFRNKIEFRRAKLIVMGDDGSGKTALIRMLPGVQNYTEQDLSIGFTTWTLCSSDETARDIDVTIHELRGEKYQPIHRVLMTAKAVYMIAIRIDKPLPRSIHTYLLSIKERCGGSESPKFIIVATHCDDLSKVDVEQKVTEFEKEIQKIANSVGCEMMNKIFRTAIDTQNPALQSALRNCFESQIFCELMPKSYEAIADRICATAARKRMNALSMAGMLSIMQDSKYLDFDLHDHEEIENVIKLFNERGVFLHYKTTLKNDGEEWFYLNPSWISRALIDVCENPNYLHKRNISDIFSILTKSLNGIDCVHDIYEVMRSYELIQVLDDNHALVLSDLPQDGPQMDIKLNGPCVCRLFRMKNTPPGFWSRLIGRLVHVFGSVPLMSAPATEASTNFISPSRLTNCQREWMLYWAKGFLLKSKKGLLRVEPLEKSEMSSGISGDDFSEGVLIRWHWMNESNGIDWSDQPYFGMTVDETERLLQEWFQNTDDDSTMKKDAICSICAQSFFCEKNRNAVRSATGVKFREQNNFLCVFPLRMLTGIATIHTDVSCMLHSDRSVSLEHLIPDLLLLDIPEIQRIAEGINIIRSLGKGGQASVFEACWPPERGCAAKTFFRSEEFMKNLDEYSSLYTSAMKTADGRRSFSMRISEIYGPKTNISTNKQIFNSACRDFVEHESLLALTFMRQEASILCTLNHPLIVKMLGIVIEPHRPFFIVLELALDGNLCDFITRSAARIRSHETEIFNGLFAGRHLIYKITHQIAIALEYLHKEHIIYRDLKAQNVLLFSTDPKIHVNVKLSDFGISCQADPQGNIGYHGTRGYQAPELINHSVPVHNEKVDIYSFGMLIYWLLTALHPFDDSLYITDHVLRGRRPSPQKDAKVKPNFASLEATMKACWAGKAIHRPSAAALRKEIETLSFFALRYSCIVRFSDNNLSNDSLLLDKTAMILTIPQSNSVCVVSRENDRHQIFVVDTVTGEFINKNLETEKHLSLLTASSDILFFLCKKSYQKDPTSEESVLILKSVGSNAFASVPDVLGTLKLHYADELNATAICAYQNQISPPEHKFFVGYASGKIARYTLHFNGKDKPEWNDTKIVRKADSTAISALLCCKFGSDMNTELIVAVGNRIQSLNSIDNSIIRTFTPFLINELINYIQVVDQTIWAGGQNLPSIAKISVIKEEREAVEQIGLETNEKLLGMRLVADNLWFTFASNVLIMDTCGSILGKLHLPVAANTSNEAISIESIEVCRSAVVALSWTSCGEKRLIIWEALNKKDIEQLEIDWKQWKDK